MEALAHRHLVALPAVIIPWVMKVTNHKAPNSGTLPEKTMDAITERFLENNRRWAENKNHQEPEFFGKFTGGQQPVALLLACSDSQVSPSVILGSDLGEIFMSRNIANVVSHTDMNFLSVLQYAVEVLGIDHIIVIGHYGCGGVKAAMYDEAIGLMDNWLANIKDVIALHKEELDAVPDENERFKRLVEINVLAQIQNLKHTSVYRKALNNGRELHLHGWVYDFSSGLIKVLTEELDPDSAV